jgi:hypothetical protein
MSTDRDLLPLHERQAARAAIEELVQRAGSQAAAGQKLGVSQNAVNKAMLYTKVGPSVMRLLLGHLEIDLPELLRRYGDPASAPAAAAAPKKHTPKDEAIETAVRFAPGVTEREIRAIASEFEGILAEAAPIDWLETLLREIQRRLLIPERQQRSVARKARTEKSALRKLHDAARPQVSAGAAPAKASGSVKGPSGR